MNGTTIQLFGVLTLSLLTACSIPDPEVTGGKGGLLFDIASVSNTGEILEGELYGHLDMTSSFDMSTSDGVRCTGRTDNNGAGEMVCDDNGDGIRDDRSYPLAIPKDSYGTQNGFYFYVYQGEVVVVGWGRHANVENLAVLLQERLEQMG